MKGMIYCLYQCAEEGAGLIADMMSTMEIPFREIRLFKGEPLPSLSDPVDGLVIMGGPMGVDDTKAHPFLKEELWLLERALTKKIPVLGVCLGAQLLAKALGERVYPNSRHELGWLPVHLTPEAKTDPVFRGVPKSFYVFQWHFDTFDLPKGAVHLAKSRLCKNQAFRVGESYGLQFHLEMTPSNVRTFTSSPQGQIRLSSAGIKPAVLNDQTPRYWDTLHPISNKILFQFFKSSVLQVAKSRASS